MTYGINTLTTFDPERHPEEKNTKLQYSRKFGKKSIFLSF
jgi:hypothetical protein